MFSWLNDWWNDRRIRMLMLLGFAVGVIYKYLLWHVWFGLHVADVMQEMPYRYMLQYVTGGIIGALAAGWGASYAKKRR